jgi:proline dehydrogenase
MIPPIASRFVAGGTAAAAIERATELDSAGVGAILNILGEHYTDPEDAAADTAAYLELVEHLADLDADVCVSVKPTQIGLDVNRALFNENAERIVSAAAEGGVFVWFDMEDHTTTDATLDAYEALAREYGSVGVCLQANLKRTPDDLERLAPLPGKVRLVKGAYDEPAAVSHTSKAAVDAAYRECLEYAFREFSGGVAVGSHDPAMVEYARKLADEYGTEYEIQMLMGVREDAQRELAGEVPVYQYVPYGGKWLSYFARRVAERRENLAFAVRAVLSG